MHRPPDQDLGRSTGCHDCANLVSADETALTTAVAKLVAQAKSAGSQGSGSQSAGSGQSGTGSSRSGSTGTGSSGASSAGRGSGGGTAVTAADLVVDQATVDADGDGVVVAQQALKQATLVSPLAGQVAEISVTPGSSISAQSAAVTVIGPGVDEVTTTVSDLNLDKVHVGATATVTPDGSDSPVQGTVTAIGLLPVSTSASSSSSGGGTRSASAASSSASSTSTSTSTSTSSSATYPVTITLATSGLYSGSGADVAILIKRSSSVLTVPTSAVTTIGTRHTVTVLQKGKAMRKLVVIGATDATRTQITSGLAKGDQVVLAQLNLAVRPAAARTSPDERSVAVARAAPDSAEPAGLRALAARVPERRAPAASADLRRRVTHFSPVHGSLT